MTEAMTGARASLPAPAREAVDALRALLGDRGMTSQSLAYHTDTPASTVRRILSYRCRDTSRCQSLLAAALAPRITSAAPAGERPPTWSRAPITDAEWALACRILATLDALDAAHGPLSPAAVARHAGMPKSASRVSAIMCHGSALPRHLWCRPAIAQRILDGAKKLLDARAKPPQ
jgi:sugar phosphate isomerase/epimerase